MTGLLAWLVPVALAMGLAGLLAFLWSMTSGQLEDLDGAAERVLHQDQDVPMPAPDRPRETRPGDTKEKRWE